MYMLSSRVCFIPLWNVEFCSSMQLLAYYFNSAKLSYYVEYGIYIAVPTLALTFPTTIATLFWGVFLTPHIWWGLFTLAEETQIVPILVLLWKSFGWLLSGCSFWTYGDSRHWLKSGLSQTQKIPQPMSGTLCVCECMCTCIYVPIF